MHGPRVRVDSREIGETAVVLRVLVVPKVLHRLDEFVGDRAPVLEVGADRTELGFEVTDADAECEAATAEHVQARDLLRKNHGIPLREDDDSRGEANRRRVRSRPGEREQ